MPTAFVLLIEDDIVGPCLELIRRICDPISTSKPHVTVRYVKRLKKTDIQISNTVISDIDYIEPGAFGLSNDNSQATVFVKCGSDVLETLSHKPHYPDSVFHVTLYDGDKQEFAGKLLELLRKFSWGFKAHLPQNTLLTKIEISKNKKKNQQHVPELNHKLCHLFWSITSKRLTYDYILGLTEDDRLELTNLICTYLHQAVAAYPKVEKHIEVVEQRVQELENSNHSRISDFESYQSGLLFPELSGKWTGDIQGSKANKVGLYLTPPELAGEIVEYAADLVEGSEVHFGDPAIGTGVFFSALSQALPPSRIASAIGIELDPKRAAATSQRWSHRGLEVVRGDYLHLDELAPRSLILANPPYVRYQHIETYYGQKLREKASQNMAMQINGQSGLYVYFLLLSHEWMSENAVAAWLIPSEFMETNYGAAIRIYLTTKVELIRVHRYDPADSQFDNALVSSAVVVFKKNMPPKGLEVVMSKGGSLREPLQTQHIKIEELSQEQKWNYPRAKMGKQRTGPKLGDLFHVCRGIATGANEFFLLERGDAAKRGIPEKFLRPVLPKARSLRFDIVETDEDGYPRTSPQLCLLDCSLSEDILSKESPETLAYLREADEIRDNSLLKNRRPWYRQEQREVPMFLSTYMGRGSHDSPPIRFIWNKSKAIATNVYLLLYPKERLAQLLSDQPSYQAKLFSLLQKTAQLGMEDYGRIYGGGLRKIEPKELLQVRLASFPKWLSNLVDKCLF